MSPATENYCANCSTWHAGGPCNHNPEAPCLEGCGRIRGFRWLGDDRKEVKPRTRCWTCWWASLGKPSLPPMDPARSECVDAGA